MLYVIIFALLLTLAGVVYLSHQERITWAAERRELLNRIQAPYAAQIAAANELAGAPEPPITDAERIRHKAEAMGVSVDALRVPEAFMGSNW
ncbi:MAG: hypothetical protein JWN15_1848 [Firmicutes bacterium]|nr:hypothetical protein [Bacillota bacterium]